MSGLTASVDGLTSLVSSLDEAASRLDDLDQVSAEAADQVVRAVEAPRVTGRLASTVAAEVDADGFTLTAGGPAAPYAAIVHARNPFLTRALDDRETAVVSAYEDHIDNTVNTIRGA